MNVEQKAKLSLSFLIQRPSAMGGYFGVTGLTPLASVRRADAVGGYLDWFDMTFKLSGWTTRLTPMTEVSASLSPGRYTRTLDTALVAIMAPGFAFAAEFAVDDGLDVRGLGAEDFVMTSEAADAALLLEAVLNPLDETPGSPGLHILRKLDGISPRITWQVRDYQGNGVVGEPGVPARRTVGVISP